MTPHNFYSTVCSSKLRTTFFPPHFTMFLQLENCNMTTWTSTSHILNKTPVRGESPCLEHSSRLWTKFSPTRPTTVWKIVPIFVVVMSFFNPCMVRCSCRFVKSWSNFTGNNRRLLGRENERARKSTPLDDTPGNQLLKNGYWNMEEREVSESVYPQRR